MFFPLIIILGVWGVSSVGDKAASLSTVYFAATVISLLLLFLCIFEVTKEKKWFILLFSSVSVVNAGYTFLSVSSSLETALLANRISYLGSVFLPFSMLMIILQVTNIKYKKWLPASLLVVAVVMFLIAASPGVFSIYYKDVSFNIVNGVSTLIKVYGPLHPLYMVYLLGYFASMVMFIIRASVKKTIDNASHAVVLAIAVFVNIGVWFIEQLTNIEFEFLSLSYIISELFILGVHLVMNENERLKEIIKNKEETLSQKDEPKKKNNEPKKCNNYFFISDEEIECFCQGLKKLTPTEKAIYEAYLCETPTKEVMNTLNIKENTLKFHNKNIYGKLGVSSRKRLLEIYKYITDDINTNREKTKFNSDSGERL